MKLVISSPPPQIDFYYSIYDEVTKIELTEVFGRWFLLNLQDFKTHLLAEVNDWIQVLKDHLKGQVMERLAFLEQFIDRGNAVLSIEITNEDYEGLLKVMEVLAEIKDKRTKFNEFFQPLLNIVELLKIYGEEFSQEMYSKVRLGFILSVSNC